MNWITISLKKMNLITGIPDNGYNNKAFYGLAC